MNKKILAFRLTLMAAAGIFVAAFIKADDPRLMEATFPRTSEEIILLASAWALPDNFPGQIIQVDHAQTWELRHSAARDDATLIFISVKAPDPMGDAKVVTWSYQRDHGYGCLEFYPSMSRFESDPSWEILAGVCLPLRAEQPIFSMDALALTNALNFAANSYITIMNSKLASQDIQPATGMAQIKGVERLEKARAIVLALQIEHPRNLRLIFGSIALVLVLSIIYGLLTLHTLDHGTWPKRLGRAAIAYAAGVPGREYERRMRRRAMAENEEKLEREVLLRLAREWEDDEGVNPIEDEVRHLLDKGRLDEARMLIELNQRLMREGLERHEARCRQQEARELFLAEAEAFGPDVAREAAERYDRDDKEGARAILEQAEDIQQRECLLKALATRVREKILDQFKQSEALKLIDEARNNLEARPHDWRKHVHRIEVMLENGNGSRRPSRPR